MKTETQPDKATSRPWQYEKTYYGESAISAETGQVIVTTCIDNGRAEGGYLAPERKANAALIVRAVNEYDCLNSVAAAADKLLMYGSFQQNGPVADKAAKAMTALLTSLAKLRSQK